MTFNVIYIFYNAVCHSLQCVHIFVLDNVFVVIFFICPRGFFTFPCDVLLGFRGILTVTTCSVLWEFSLFIFTGSIALLSVALFYVFRPFFDSWVFAVFPPVFCLGFVFSFLLGPLSCHFRNLFVNGIFHFILSVGNKFVDDFVVVGASLVGSATTISSFLT